MSRQYSLSSLQKKGVLVLSLLLVAESVTFSNALKLWTNYEAFLDETTSGKRSRTGNFFKFKEDIFGGQNDQCSNAPPTVSAIGTITTTTATKSQGMIKSKLLSPLVRLSDNVKNRFGDDCCRRCSQYMEPSKALEQCGVIRGGHSAAQHAAEKVADAMAQGGSEVTPYGIPLHLWKIIFQAILTTINVACWLLPLRSKKMSENKLGLSLANAFSGGVFLSLAFGHLIPECVHGFADYQEVTPYMLVLAGYLLIFFVEKVAFDSHSILHEMEHAGEHKQPDGGNKANGEVDAPQATGSRSAVILLGALAVHSILEMMALGLADSFGDCALLTLSIALHQPAESIALLVAFLKSGMPKSQIIQYLSVFSAMGPIGVALGIAVNEFAAPIVDAVFLAIVAGTFVYVGATEVIPEEWEESEHKWKKFAALMSGIISIFAITQYTATLHA